MPNREKMEKAIEAVRAGFGGVNKKGHVVDRRLPGNEDAQPIQMNSLLGVPKPKKPGDVELPELPLAVSIRKKGKFTPAQVERGKIGRNELCPCGSGKKFKRCCLH